MCNLSAGTQNRPEPPTDEPPVAGAVLTDPPILDIAQLSVAYGDRVALADVTFSVGGGSIYGLLGPNGAGKTTLVRTIGGRLVPRLGSVRISGEAPRKLGRRSAIGLVPQQIALYPHLTARENLSVFGRLMRAPKAELASRIGDFLDRAALASRADDLVSALSGGMQRRINIGAALMHRPELLVLDEPTVGVDLHAREAIHELLIGLREDGYAILLATHDMDQAAALSDRVGIIHEGALLAEGTPRALVAEAFAGGKEVVVTTGGEIDAAKADVMTRAGLAQRRGTRVWSGPASGDFDAAAPVVEALSAAGIAITSVNVQEPTLGSVFFQVVGRELEN